MLITSIKNKYIRLVTLMCAVVIASLALQSPCAFAAEFRNVVIVSIDALHPKALNTKYAPLTCDMLKKGALTRKGQSTNPPKTLVSHAAMMTGKGPDQGGRLSNVWEPGEPTVEGRTIFDLAKDHGYRTGFFYSKSKLGFLRSDAIDVVEWARDETTDRGAAFLKRGGRNFAFIHVSGLDFVGPEFGWLSPEYLEELSYIDQYLEDIYRELERSGNYLLIVTSDHAGYEKDHGGNHPDEARLPFGVVSDVCSFPEMNKAPYQVIQLPTFLQRAINCTP